MTPTSAAERSSRPFVGRIQELADLVSALEDTASGRGSLVLLTGEPGIGKTRLMSEVAQVARQDRTVRWPSRWATTADEVAHRE
jgi:MoxR-like ATPase